MGVAFIGAAFIAGYCCWAILEANAAASAKRAFRGFLISLVTVFAAVFLVLNALLYGLLVRPVRQIVHIAERPSVGDMLAADFPAGGPQEIRSLVRSFNRMRTSLETALRS